MIVALILAVASIAFAYWLFSDDERAKRVSSGINAASLAYYSIVGIVVMIAVFAMLASGQLQYQLFGAFVLFWILVIARVKLGNTRRALAN